MGLLLKRSAVNGKSSRLKKQPTPLPLHYLNLQYYNCYSNNNGIGPQQIYSRDLVDHNVDRVL